MPQPRSTRGSGASKTKKGTAASGAAKPRAKRAAGGGKDGGGKDGAPARAAAAPIEEAADERGQIARLLNPLDVVLLTRERIQVVLDDAVDRGRMTRGDATELATTLIERGRRQTEDLLADIEQLLGRSREQLDETTTDVKRKTRNRVAGPADRVLREMDRARRAAGIGTSFPISGYDDLTAAQVTGRLGDLTPAELRKVRDYERKNANRKSVLAAVEQKLG
jgi:polyhydroxyalkanoate synthesis regulator phasin